ncbi:MAG: hypothetical protein RJB11_1499, partial [Planctomycetota bacterium]
MQLSSRLGVPNRGLSPVNRGLSPVDAGDLFFAKYYRILGYVASKTVHPWPILSLLSNNPP